MLLPPIARKGARMPRTSSSLIPAKPARISLWPAISLVHFFLLNCNEKRVLRVLTDEKRVSRVLTNEKTLLRRVLTKETILPAPQSCGWCCGSQSHDHRSKGSAPGRSQSTHDSHRTWQRSDTRWGFSCLDGRCPCTASCWGHWHCRRRWAPPVAGSWRGSGSWEALYLHTCNILTNEKRVLIVLTNEKREVIVLTNEKRELIVLTKEKRE